MTNKTIELTYNENLNNKIISKIGNPFKFENEKLQEFSNRNNGTDHVCEGKKILVIRMLDLAKMYARNNSVVYLTDNEEFHKEFINKINNEKYGGDDCSYLINDWKNLNNFIETNFGGDMKFDVIIGNPPYEGKYTPLYLQILEVCQKVADKVIWLCPAQWVKSYHYTNGCEEIRKVVGKTLCSYEHISNPFEDAEFANEVGIYEFDYNKENIDYNEIFWDKFSNKELAKSIVSKFISYKDNVNKHSDRTNVSILPGNWCNICRIRGDVIRKGLNAGTPLWNWTTLFAKDTKNNFQYRIGTHMNHIKFDTVEECKNFISYTETDIVMFALFTSKDNNNQTPSMLALIPWLGDYTKQWTEDEIANELGLTKEEVDYIHEEMKPFGWKTQPKNRKKRKSKRDYFANMQE